MLTVYKSSAGAGKTFTLAGNYIDLLFSMHGKNRHRKILAVTFTKKATAEMKSRIISELNKLAKGIDSDHADGLKKKYCLTDEELRACATSILTDILQDYGWFAVSTIDSFFQQIIRSFAREMNLPGAYNLELDSNRILQMAVDDYFFNLPSDIRDERLNALMQIIEENIANSAQWNPKNTILNLSKELLNETYQTYQTKLKDAFDNPDVLKQYRKQLRQIQTDYYEKYRSLEQGEQSLLGGCQETDFSYGNNLFAPFHWNEEDIKKAVKGDKTYSRLLKFANNESNILKSKYTTEQAALVEPLRKQALALVEMLAGKEAENFITANAILRYLNYLKILQDIRYYIENANAELNRLPLSETNRLLNEVIAGQGDSPFVYDKIGTRIAHYMIDEFQDTSGMQWQNFRPLVQDSVAGGGCSMLVGDVKQSIYRWRNSDSGLLQYGVNNDFRLLEERVLDTNWRSDEVVVNENNNIFKQVARAIQDDYNNAASDRSSRITDMYSTVEQKVHKEEKGYVRIEFVETDEKVSVRHRNIAERIPDIVNDVKARGIRLGKIAVLIRRNKDAEVVAEALMQAKIKVMSNEALLISSSAAVRLIADIMRITLCPEDRILCLQTAYEYALCKGYSTEEALRKALFGECSVPLISLQGSLGEQVTTIVETLRLEENESVRPYLQAFRDEVFQYEQKYPADVFSFLQWWDDRKEKAAIQMNETGDAVQIVSIHKSKGLEYDVVIIPFCDWDKSVSQNRTRSDILWVVPKEEPFNKLPVVPVKFEKILAKSKFKDEYFRELENLYIDNLNLAYVAFTRAKRELYVFAPVSEEGKEPDNMGAVLHSVLKDSLTDNLYERGEKVRETCELKDTGTEQHIPYYNGETTSLQVKLPSRDYFMRETDNRMRSGVNIGTLMHEVLCNIIIWDDVPEVVESMIVNGRLSGEDIQIVRTELQKVCSLTAHTNWFDSRWQVINEHDIILQDGSVRRPDRLLLCDSEAVIVDWKFGYAQPDEHKNQVREYVRLLEDMGYKTQGWLCYVNRKEIVKV